MTETEDRTSWTMAASQAHFAWFAPVGPDPIQTWAGGFGWDPAGPSVLEVCALCDAVEVSVESRLLDNRLNDGVSQRLMVHELLWHAIVDDRGPLSLPMTIVLEPDDREIAVDGIGVTFAGVRLVGSDRWTGMAKVDGVSVKLITAAPVPNLAIATTTDTSLPEAPPQ